MGTHNDQTPSGANSLEDAGEAIEPEEVDEAPPLLGSWRNLYILVIVTLISAIILLYLFSEAYA